MVEWIEIVTTKLAPVKPMVSTLVVEWIEIHTVYEPKESDSVSTLVVEWIEICRMTTG